MNIETSVAGKATDRDNVDSRPQDGARRPQQSPPLGQSYRTVSLFGIQIDPVVMDLAVDKVWRWFDDPGQTCRMVVTPNLDHAVMFQQHAGFRAAYQRAELVVADGWPLVVASRLLRRALPERVSGADLVPALFARATAARPLTVFLLGAGPGVALQAAEQIHRQWPAVQVLGTHSPPPGFEDDDLQNAEILASIAAASPDLLVVGLGAPKQELWVNRHLDEIHARAVVCAGATIDFIAGEKRRAPRWVRTIGMEWCHRLCNEPRRLVRRYARDAWALPGLLWRELNG